ncbi:UNVERIFIED_CONTAM: hypothetical protein GTU68_056380 [Idotea baltica]|nr:hypothetical protein [Idotea baltica]
MHRALHSAIYSNIAISIDARNLSDQLPSFPQVSLELKQQALHYSTLYLYANTETLVTRFSETRRKHPLTNEHRSLVEAIIYEQELLQPIYNNADLTVNTSDINEYQLRDFLKQHVIKKSESSTAFLIESFAFKKGIPSDSDLVFDVRCLPNPYWIPELRQYSGLDAPVINYLNTQSEVSSMYEDILTYVKKWLPRLASNNRAYVTVAIGCTGGKHRSVYIVDRLGKDLSATLSQVQVRHRDHTLS